jgi:hypothetical protein
MHIKIIMIFCKISLSDGTNAYFLLNKWETFELAVQMDMLTPHFVEMYFGTK